MTDQGVIILKRSPGPSQGLTIVTVDAPGFTQADFVVASHVVGTPDEEVLLRRMLEQRRAIADALTSEDI